MLHALIGEGGILDNGLVPREVSGKSAARFADGRAAMTLTPLCTDVWDVRQNTSIKDFFDYRSSHWKNRGESNFLSSSLPLNYGGGRSPITVILDKKSMHPDLLKNSFNVNQNGRSQLIKEGLIGGIGDGIHDYPTHRAIPIGAPANSIEKIIVDTRRLSRKEISQIQDKIRANGLDVKIYDMNGILISG